MALALSGVPITLRRIGKQAIRLRLGSFSAWIGCGSELRGDTIWHRRRSSPSEDRSALSPSSGPGNDSPAFLARGIGIRSG